MDVVVNVAIGTGSNEEKMAFLGQVASQARDAHADGRTAG